MPAYFAQAQWGLQQPMSPSSPIVEPLHQRASVAGENLELLPERAIYWPRESTLLIADAHFGKAAAFRARGVPVPEATTLENLERLSELIRIWAPLRIAFLGDFTHAREARCTTTQNALRLWRAQHRTLELVLVRGNHDPRDDSICAMMAMRTIEEPWRVGAFALRHLPQPDDQHYVLAGHLHPAFRLQGRAYERARLPCFWFGEQVGVLPAFGAFTGALSISPAAGERIYLVGPNRVYALPIPGESK